MISREKVKNYIIYSISVIVCFLLFSFEVSALSYEISSSSTSVNVSGGLDDFASVYSIDQGDGAEYLDFSECSAGGTSCVVKVSNEGKNVESFTATFTIKYKTNSGKTTVVEIYLSGNFTNYAYIYPGGGTCSLSGWTQADYTDSSGYTTYKRYYANAGTALPSCTYSTDNSSSNKKYTFKGWSTAANNDQHIYLASGGETCNSVSAGTASVGGKNYYACYEEETNFVVINTGGGTIAGVGETWEQAYKYSSSSYVHYGSSSTDTITLPEVTLSGFNKDKTVEAWVNQSTGQEVSPGTAVATDGTTWNAKIVTSSTTKNLKKSIYVNETKALVVSGMTACSSANSSYVSVNYVSYGTGSGECQVTGVAQTDDYIDITTMIDGEEVVYQYKVLANASQSATDEFSVNLTVQTLTGVSNSTSNTDNIISQQCNTFTVDYLAASGTWGEPDGINMTSTLYKVTPNDCDTDYIALCIDPGLNAPNGNSYKRTNDLDGASNLKKLIVQIINHSDYNASNFSSANNSFRIAAHLAVRVVTITEGLSSGTTASGATHYYIYKDAADVLKEANTDSVVTESEAKKVAGQLGIYNGTAVYNYFVEFLTGFTSIQLDASTKIEREINSSEVYKNPTGNNSNQYYIAYEGIIYIPESLVSNGAATFDPCSGVSGVLTCHIGTVTQSNGSYTISDDSSKFYDTGTVENGRVKYAFSVVIEVKDASKLDIPEDDDGKLVYGFKLNYDGGTTVDDIFIISPTDGDCIQRMILFNTSSPQTYIYFPVSLEGFNNSCDDIDAIDYEAHCNASGCDSSFNEELFTANNCCAYVTDEVSYAYIIDNLCSYKCVTSTLSSVCDYRTEKSATTELYTIEEGTYTNSSGNVVNHLGSCVVSVNDDWDEDPHAKEKDDNGNSLVVDYYEDNPYCRVTCSENWDMSLESFGNFVGENAVAAGTYFKNTSDIYISGTRTCYTTYILTGDYQDDVTSASNYGSCGYKVYSDNEKLIDEISAAKSSGALAEIVVGYECDRDSSDSISDGVCSYTSKSKRVRRTCGSDETAPCYTTVYYCESGYNKNNSGQSYSSFTCYYDAKELYGYAPTSDSPISSSYSSRVCNTCTNPLDVDATTVSDEDDCYTPENKLTCDYTTVPDKSKTGPTAVISCDVDETPVEKVVSTGHAVNSKKDEAKSTYTFTKSSWKSTELDGNDIMKEICDDYNADGGYCNTDSYNDGSFDDNTGGAGYYLSSTIIKQAEIAAYDAQGIMVTASAALEVDFDNMYACQHFELFNISDEEKTDDLIDLPYVSSTTTENYIKISTGFNPSATYTYDEKEFLTILGDDNILVEDLNKDNKIFEDAGVCSGSYSQCGSGRAKTTLSVFDENGNAITKDVYLYRNYSKVYYYHPGADGDWEMDDDDAYNCTYLDEDDEKCINDPDGPKGDGTLIENRTVEDKQYEKNSVSSVTCTDTTKGCVCNTKDGCKYYDSDEYDDYGAIYLDVNYISVSLSNSSFYKNKGYWYIKSSDVKEHGDTKSEALENANERAGSTLYPITDTELKLWSAYGGAIYANESIYGDAKNVFPVSLDTARNLYVYTYTFGGIGYFNNGTLGRLMGTEQSVIAVNTRSCFYEIYEEVCICCGSEITTHVYGSSSVVTEDFLDSNTDYNYTLSNSDELATNTGGTLAISTATVNLADLDSSESRVLASNWSDNSPFVYSGNNYLTYKGEDALTAIEAAGENAYDDEAEYSFYLTPQTLSAIREYNDEYGYEVNYDNLILYGSISMVPVDDSCSDASSCNWDADSTDDEMVTLNHYGSKFLEEFMEGENAVYSNSISKRKTDENVCVVVSSDYTTDLVNDLMHNTGSKCRWVDYIEDSSKLGNDEKNYDDDNSSILYFRLAFK